MKVETKESLIATIIAREIFKRSVFDKDDIKRLIEKELKKFKL